MWRSTPDASDISSRRIWAQSFGMLRHASSAQLRSYPGPDSIVGRVLELGHTQCSRPAASFATMTQACQPAEAKRGHQPMKNPWFDNQGFRQAEGYMLESSGVQMWCANLHTQNQKPGLHTTSLPWNPCVVCLTVLLLRCYDCHASGTTWQSTWNWPWASICGDTLVCARAAGSQIWVWKPLYMSGVHPSAENKLASSASWIGCVTKLCKEPAVCPQTRQHWKGHWPWCAKDCT